MLQDMPGILRLDLRFSFGQLIQSPLVPGVWALLPPVGGQNHAPQLCWLDRGRLACVWMAGAGEGTAGMSIFLSILRIGSGRWSKPRQISVDSSRSEQNPLMYVDSSNRVHLIHTAQNVRGEAASAQGDNDEPFSMQWTARLRHQSSSLSRIRWSLCNDLLPDPAFCRHPPYAFQDGTYALPVYRSLKDGGAFGSDYSEVIFLDCKGNFTGEISSVPQSTGRVQGSIVRSSNGDKLLQFFRSRLADRIYCSYGDLDGRSWSPPFAIDLPNNNSSIQAFRLSSGRLAIIYNHFCFERDGINAKSWGEASWPRTRWPLSIALSEDDGKTWPWIRVIDAGLGYSGSQNWYFNGQLAYPSILEGSPGEIHVAYSWGNRAAIRYVCIPEADIMTPDWTG